MVVEMELYFAVASLIICAFNIVGLFAEHFKSRERIARLETKIEPFWKTLENNIPSLISAITKSKNPHSNPHNPNGEARKKELLDRMHEKTLGPREANELTEILERELAEARERGDTTAILALLLLLGLLAAIIYAASR